MEEKISFQTDEGEVLFYILEETRIAGVNYLLVTDSDSEEAECYILRDTSKPEDKEASYEMVEDDETLSALWKVFRELLSDTDLQLPGDSEE